MTFILGGKKIPAVKVTNISKHGIWLLTRDEEFFVSFNEFPGFRDASVSQIMNVEWPDPDHLSWPDLHVNLPLQSIRRFPLVSNSSHSTIRPGRHARTGTYRAIEKQSAFSSDQNVARTSGHHVSEDSALPSTSSQEKSDEGITVQSENPQ